MLYLMFGQLDFNLVRLIRDFQLRVQPALCFLQPVCQFPPGLMKLNKRRLPTSDTEKGMNRATQTEWGKPKYTCLALLRASSRWRPRSSDLCTSLSQRACTLSSRFLMRTTSCLRLANRSWEPAFSRARTCSLWVFTSFTNTWNIQE